MVSAIVADVKSDSPLDQHPQIFQILETLGFPSEIINMMQDFLTKRETYLSFNGFDSSNFPLNHSLPQVSLRSPLLYQLHKTHLSVLADTHTHSNSLGFAADVVLLTAASNQHKISGKFQTLACSQIYSATRHGAIFDTQNSNWIIFTPKAFALEATIDFGDRISLKPVHKNKGLGVTLDSQLSFRHHCDEFIAKVKGETSSLVYQTLDGEKHRFSFKFYSRPWLTSLRTMQWRNG